MTRFAPRQAGVRSISKSQFQPVVSDPHTGREVRFAGLRELVANMGEERLGRAYFPRHFQSLAHAEMRRMRLMAQRIYNQNSNPAISRTISSGTALQSLK
jgi:hypothetical protein